MKDLQMTKLLIILFTVITLQKITYFIYLTTLNINKILIILKIDDYKFNIFNFILHL